MRTTRPRQMRDGDLYHEWSTLVLEELLTAHTCEQDLRRRQRLERELVRREMIHVPQRSALFD